MYQLDSAHIWHVAKTGNDGNGGHAAQYPINLASDAKLTISAAVTAASSGDTIIIWPGDYAEAVSAGGKALAFIGTNRNKSKIVPASGDGLTLDDDSSVKNLSIEALGNGAIGLVFSAKENLTIENCNIHGYLKGIYLYGSKYVFLKNCRFLGNWIGASLGSVKGLFAENCIFQTSGADGVQSSKAVYGMGQGAFLNCAFLAERNDTSSEPLYVVFFTADARATFLNCVFEASAGANHTGAISGVYVNGTNAVAVLKNCSIHSVTSGNPSSGPYDLVQVAGVIRIASSYYETSSGTIIRDYDGSEDDVTRLIKATKLLINKAIQNKSTGAIDYYEDDGETIALTHTPDDGESEITRTPS